jgi:hypothetical protein
MVSFHWVLPPKPCIHLSCPPYITHAPPIPFLISSPEWYLVSMEHKAPYYVVFSTSLWPRPSWAQITSSVSYSSDSVPHLEFDAYLCASQKNKPKARSNDYYGFKSVWCIHNDWIALTVLNQNIRDLFNKYSGLICSLKTN